jgi:hypothetical protein
MYAYRLRIAALAAVAAVGLAACTTPYGYGGVSVGNGYYGSNYGYGGDYGYGYGAGYPGYGYGYGAGYPGYALGYAPYWGWYDGFYYPGTGYYVYDAYRRPHRWNDAQRRHWTECRERALSSSNDGQRVVIRENWNDFSRNRSAVRPTRVNRNDDRTVRIERGTRPVRVERNVATERVERGTRPVRVERGVATERVERGNRPERIERSAVRSETRNNATAREQRRAEASAARVQPRSEAAAAREERTNRSNSRGRGGNQDD